METCAEEPPIDVCVLGALDVQMAGISILPTAPKPRQVFALLAMRGNQVVSPSTLIEELWGAKPPRSARNTLQTYVLQLRELITAAQRKHGEQQEAKKILATLPGGYQFQVGERAVDAEEFERRAASGYRAVAAGDFSGASRRLRGALSLWKGPAFSDVRTGRLLTIERQRLEEAKLSAVDQRIDADLRLGRYRELLGELTALVNRYRTHESLHAQLMVALHHSGRRGEALGVYQRLRSTLVQELGLEPSVRLRRLQHSILVADPGRATVDWSMSSN
ncbi:BTAD domain-containing putative transcriptional regulator [Micromonospora sp. NPDC018662]|uniref:AfsR/SARP family transcriptional regulator n=1 Tax=Micromonospora sp. NPDC018662 TaxID=3364238 RepID=UPI0037B60CE1